MTYFKIGLSFVQWGKGGILREWIEGEVVRSTIDNCVSGKCQIFLPYRNENGFKHTSWANAKSVLQLNVFLIGCTTNGDAGLC